MEKTEYKIKMDQVENLVRQGDLKEAVDVLDTLNYQKIRNVNVLLRASEIAEEAGDLEKSREILEIAHENSPIARMIIYRLALISVKMGEFEEADTYYNSSSETPQMSEYLKSIDMSIRLFKELKTLILPSFVTPVRNAKRMKPSLPRGALKVYKGADCLRQGYKRYNQRRYRAHARYDTAGPY